MGSRLTSGRPSATVVLRIACFWNGLTTTGTSCQKSTVAPQRAMEPGDHLETDGVLEELAPALAQRMGSFAQLRRSAF